MTRSVLAVMAGLLCALLGMKHSADLYAEERRLRRWYEVLRHLAVILQEQAVPLPEALCQAANGDAVPDRLLRNMASHMQGHPLDPLQDAYRHLCGPCTENAALHRIFAALGRGTLAQRVLGVTQGAEEIALLAASARTRAEKDAKLFRTLGWTGGACLTILLL